MFKGMKTTLIVVAVSLFGFIGCDNNSECTEDCKSSESVDSTTSVDETSVDTVSVSDVEVEPAVDSTVE